MQAHETDVEDKQLCVSLCVSLCFLKERFGRVEGRKCV